MLLGSVEHILSLEEMGLERGSTATFCGHLRESCSWVGES